MGNTTVTTSVSELGWPATRLGEALTALARHTGLGGRTDHAPLTGPGKESADDWIEASAAWLGLEAEPVETPYPEVGRLVATAGPALLRLPSPAGARFLVLLGSSRGRLAVLTPECSQVWVSAESVRATLCRPAEALVEAEIEGLLTEAG